MTSAFSDGVTRFKSLAQLLVVCVKAFPRPIGKSVGVKGEAGQVESSDKAKVGVRVAEKNF